ncbi:hypothetical protein BYT27DRAFT_7224460 [Phlegmacium glaucopus]|nr:hypothetical protein BYT27DRAFT_7224460 [Phlegmacium glaucopus]
MLELFSQEVSPSSSLFKSVLAMVPHIADVEDSKCKIAYTNQKYFENLIIKAQGQKICKPIANSIWRLVILDKYVDFEKFFVTLEPGYNPNNEAKELNDRFTLLEKNSISSRCAIVSEAEWMCLYDAWVNAVLLFYPHRKVELSSYREVIINMFQATLSPLPAIKYDHDSHECYARQPCHLDSSKDTLPFPLLSQLLSSSHVTLAPSSSSVVSTTSAVNAMDLIKPKTRANASQLSPGVVSIREQQQLEVARRKAHEAQSAGTQQLKRKAGFVWDKSLPSPLLSPSALATETASPLASPPPHLLNDPGIQSTLLALHDFIHAKVCYDDMQTFGQVIFNAKQSFPDEPLVTWKSDVALAFLNLLAHPIYQLRQVIDVEGVWHLQAQLLMLWDKIGCPWNEKKQEFGAKLKTIGFYVDINQGTLTLTDDAIADIITAIRAFLATLGQRPSL